MRTAPHSRHPGRQRQGRRYRRAKGWRPGYLRGYGTVELVEQPGLRSALVRRSRSSPSAAPAASLGGQVVDELLARDIGRCPADVSAEKAGKADRAFPLDKALGLLGGPELRHCRRFAARRGPRRHHDRFVIAAGDDAMGQGGLQAARARFRPRPRRDRRRESLGTQRRHRRVPRRAMALPTSAITDRGPDLSRPVPKLAARTGCSWSMTSASWAMTRAPPRRSRWKPSDAVAVEQRAKVAGGDLARRRPQGTGGELLAARTV